MKKALLTAVMIAILTLAVGPVTHAQAGDTATMSLGDHVFDPSQHVSTRGSWSFVWLNYKLPPRKVCDAGCQTLLDAAVDMAIKEYDLEDITFSYVFEHNLMGDTIIGVVLHHNRKGGWEDKDDPIAIANSVFTLDNVNTRAGWSWVPIAIHWGRVPPLTKIMGNDPGQWFEPFCEALNRVEEKRGKVYSFQVFQNATGITGVKLRHKED